jgi:ATP-binding cassette, subfamily B, bacterial MsbA
MLQSLKTKLRSVPDSSGALIYRLFGEYGRRHMGLFLATVVLMGIVAGCTALSASLVGLMINRAYVYKDFQGLVAVCLAAVGIFSLKGFASYGQAVTLAYVSNRITAENQRKIFDKLLREGVGYFADRHSTDFLARLSYAANSASAVLGLLVTALARDLLSVVGLMAVMLYQDPVMSVIAFVIAPPAVVILRKLMQRVRRIAQTQFEGSARILETTQETIQGFRVIKAFNLEEAMRKRIYQDVARVEHAANKLARASNRSSPLMESLGGIAIGLVAFYAGVRFLKGGAAPGEFASFATAFLLAYEPTKRLARLNIDLNNALYGVQILFQLLDSPSSEADDRGRPSLALHAGRIEFSEVDFRYKPEAPVLRKMSFGAEPGRVTALVGPSGGGKSTVFNLILRLYEVDGGAIVIDGQNIAAVSRQSVREQIGYVGQDVFLFRGTIRENIAYGRLDATEEEIVAAAEAAFAHQFITEFPLGYETPVGEHGLQLSGGQRQRISVARALIKNAPVILLDEPTASLDSEAERHVQEAISHLCEGRTTLVIAHRLHTITQADCIHVVDDGRIVESGRHEELLGKQGRYAEVFRIQFKSQLESAASTREPGRKPGSPDMPLGASGEPERAI